MSKLWSGRFSEQTDALVDEFNASIPFDKRLVHYDINGSLAHLKMLEKQGIISPQDSKQIAAGLVNIATDIIDGNIKMELSDEDVHMAVEKRLIEFVGPVGGKLHTARSRNDQVAVDFRLYIKDQLAEIRNALLMLMKTIFDKAKDNITVIMPGDTHLQSAQPVLFAHYIMAYFQMLRRDYERMGEIAARADFCPLGAGALAGTSFPIDRHFTSQELGFAAPTENSMDSVSDRDFALEFLSAASICMMHLSRFSEEIIIYSSADFSFVELSDKFSTGSSIMPQKKNPDIAELVRGKTGRVYGDMVALFTTMKGLPLAYNKDMQEDKERVFDAADTLLASLVIFAPMLASMKLNADRMLKAASKGYSTATDMADYLVRKGLPFREAHHATGQAVAYAVAKDKMLQELSLEELKKFSPLADKDIFNFITVEASVASRTPYGGTAPSAVSVQLENAEKFLAANNAG